MTYETLWHRLIGIYEADEAKAIVRWVLDVRFGLSLTDILCGKVTQLSADDQAELEKIMQRLEKAEPVQYVVGYADFCGRQFYVAPGVLIPRPETAELCRWIIREDSSAVQSVLDIGAGSGCIAVTLALELSGAQVTAWDISEDALRIAAGNAEALGANVTFERQDALSLSLSDGRRWDLIVSNPPYIKLQERDGMAENVLGYEPELALFGPANDPALFYKRIGDYAIRTLTPAGRLFFELNPLTAGEVDDYLKHLGFLTVEVRADQYGRRRFLKAMKL